MRAFGLLVALFVGGCEELTGDGKSCSAMEDTFTLDGEQEPPMRLRVESCRVDVAACPSLCQVVLDESSQTFGQVKTCDVEFRGDEVRLAIQYTTCPPPNVDNAPTPAF